MQKFCNILVDASLCHVYHVTEAVQAMGGTVFGSIVVVGAVTCCALLHSM